MSLFLEDSDGQDSDTEIQLDLSQQIKRRKLAWLSDIESESDLDSDADEWENVPLTSTSSNHEQERQDAQVPIEASFDISIKSTVPDEVIKQRNRVKQTILEKKRRKSIQYLGMTTYMLHAKQRNAWLSNKKVLKAVRKLLPQSLLKGHIKKFQNALGSAGMSNWNTPQSITKQTNNTSSDSELDVQLIYILRYLIKWFRLNFKFNSNGIRNLGYVPDLSKLDKYFPSKAPSITSTADFIKMIKKFKHNRDTAAQVFTCLLRSLGFEARLVFSLPLLPKDKTAKQPPVNLEKLASNKDNDLLYPYFWTELVNPIDHSEILVLEVCCFHDDSKRLTRLSRYTSQPNTSYTPSFYPIQSQFNQMNMQYVIALDNSNLLLDVTSRYRQDVAYRWFDKLDLRTDDGRFCLLFQTLLRFFNRSLPYCPSSNMELSALRDLAMANYTVPSTFSAMKRNSNLVTHSTLRYNEVIPLATPSLKSIKLKGTSREVPVFFRNSVIVGKSETQWKFLGRSVKPEEVRHPIKSTTTLTPRTIYNRRVYNLNIANNEHEQNQIKLYSFAQTCPFISQQVVGGLLPRNKFGNIEIFHECMIPSGCVWIKLSSIERILKKYKSKELDAPFTDQIQFVSVVVGFCFTALRSAIPVKQGVIVLKEQEILTKKVWLYGKIQMDSKDPRIALGGWNYLLRMLRITNHLNKAYGEC